MGTYAAKQLLDNALGDEIIPGVNDDETLGRPMPGGVKPIPVKGPQAKPKAADDGWEVVAKAPEGADEGWETVAPPPSGYGHRAKEVLTAKVNPLEAIPGTAEALAAGAVGLGGAAVRGIGGGIAKLLGGDYDIGAATAAGITGMGKLEEDVAPVTDAGKKLLDVLGLIPEGLHAIGESVFDKTGEWGWSPETRALSASGFEALATLVMLKPGASARVVGKAFGKGSKEKGAAETRGAFEILAASDKKKAQEIADTLTNPKAKKRADAAIARLNKLADEGYKRQAAEEAAAKKKTEEGVAALEMTRQKWKEQYTRAKQEGQSGEAWVNNLFVEAKQRTRAPIDQIEMDPIKALEEEAAWRQKEGLPPDPKIKELQEEFAWFNKEAQDARGRNVAGEEPRGLSEGQAQVRDLIRNVLIQEQPMGPFTDLATGREMAPPPQAPGGIMTDAFKSVVERTRPESPSAEVPGPGGYSDLGRPPKVEGMSQEALKAFVREQGFSSLSAAVKMADRAARATPGELAANPKLARAKEMVEGLRGKFYSNPEIELMLGLFSGLGRRVAEIGSTASGTEWVKRLDAWESAGKIKRDEVEATGIKEWVATRPGKVTKQDVAEFIRSGGVKLEEKELGGAKEVPPDLPAMRRRLEELGYTEEYGEVFRIDGTEIDNPWDLPQEVQHLVNVIVGDAGVGGPKYEGFKIPGGENYREVLLKTPESTIPVPVTEEGLPVGYTLREYFQKGYGPAGKLEAERTWELIDDKDGTHVFEWLNGDYPTRAEAVKATQEWLRKNRRDLVNRSAGENYHGPHWDDPNVVAHMRIDDRVDAAGRRVMFVNEIQSDWGQAKKKSPQSTPSGPFTRGKTEPWVALAIKRLLAKANEEGYEVLAFPKGEEISKAVGAPEENVKFYNDMLPKIVERVAKKVGGKVETIEMKKAGPGRLVESPNMVAVVGERGVVIDHWYAEKSSSTGHYRLFDRLGESASAKVFDSLESAMAAAKEIALKEHADMLTPDTRLGVNLTPEVKTAVGRGQELFANPETKIVGDIAKKFRGSKLERELTAVLQSTMRAVAPEMLGAQAKAAAAVLAKNYATMAHEDAVQYSKSEPRRMFWEKRPTEQLPFLSDLEHKKTFADPEMAAAAVGYEAWAKKIYESDVEMGLNYPPRENYIPHLFKDPEGAAQYLASTFGTKFGDPRFIKARTSKYIEQAVAAGYELKTTNPEELMGARQHASNIAHMKIQALRDFVTYGLARRLEKGDTLKAGEYEWRAPNGELYALPDGPNQIMHNAFNTQSLWNMENVAGSAYRALMGLKNLIVPVKLFSLFHPIHVQLGMTSADALVSATKQLAAGTKSVSEFALDAIGQVVMKDIISRPKEGWRMMQIFEKETPFEQIPLADRRSLQLLLEGGFVPGLSSEFKGQAIRNFTRAVQERSATAAWHLPWAALEKIWTRPIFEVWIPSLKTASYLKGAYAALEANPALLENPLARMEALRKLQKSIDNRYGEMNYNSTFMNKMIKDVGVGSLLSYGWQVGFIREGGGGLITEPIAALRNKGSLREKITKGELDRTLFVGYYTAMAMLYGGLMTYALSGVIPQDWLDYFYPRSGGTNPDGSPARVSTPFYTREAISVAKHMQNEGVGSGTVHLIGSKLNPAIGTLTALASNIDFFGNEISDPDSPFMTRLGQKLKYTLGDLEPSATQSVGRLEAPTATDRALALAGFNPAPKYIYETPTEAAIASTYRRYHKPTTPYAKAQQGKEARELRNAYKQGDMDKVEILLDQMQDKYNLTANDRKNLFKNADSPGTGTERMFKRLSWDQQLRIMKKMEPEELERFTPLANKKARDRMEDSDE